MLHLPQAPPAGLAGDWDALQPLKPATIARWRYAVGEDWDGDPAISFYIVLRDKAAEYACLPQTAREIRDFVIEHLHPLGRWELIPYFHFRSESEQSVLKDETFG